jgi:DNA-binding CsgD family transcriptional regulator
MRALRLSASDQKRLAAAARAFLSPVEAPSLEDWSLRVGSMVRGLIDADQFIVRYPFSGAAVLCSDVVDVAVIRAYPDSCRQIAGRTGMWQRGVQLRVYTREQLWHGHMDEYFRSGYYHETIVPNRGFHATGMSAAVHAELNDATVAQLLFHKQTEATRGFAERELAILNLLHPSFEAGVHAAARLLHERDTLARVIDHLNEAIAIFDPSATLIHRNHALRRMMGIDGVEATLAREVERLARHVSPLLNSLRRVDEPGVPDCRLVRDVSIGPNHFKIRASLLAANAVGTDSAIMITVDKVGLELLGDLELRERYDLTRREAETARLVAKGYTNERLAARLGISVPTARHHVEAVLLKLGIHSRGEVASAIAGGAH